MSCGNSTSHGLAEGTRPSCFTTGKLIGTNSNAPDHDSPTAPT
jgi:hypothetical protein